MSMDSASPCRLFQFTRPRGARRACRASRKPRAVVSIHAPARGATRPVPPGRGSACFNSRAREGRDVRRVEEAQACGVSIHAPARGATEGRDLPILPFEFQFTRPRGARRRAATCRSCPSSFNSRAREGRDLAQPENIGLTNMFQFTRPRGARRRSEGVRPSAAKFQFTRPRGARHATRIPEPDRRIVSIHAPARGATRVAALQGSLVEVSIHAPARGATKRTASGKLKCMFQFTRPRGARQGFAQQSLSYLWFQFTRPRGARLHPARRGFCTRKFQFTRPRGARPRCTRTTRTWTRFNSRAREGRDAHGDGGLRAPGVSIHAPARGATASSGSEG